MSLLFMDGFDHYATADIAKKWTSLSTVYFFINTTGGRRSSGCIECNSSAGGFDLMTKTLQSNYSTIVMGAAVYISSSYNGSGIFAMREETTAHLNVVLDSIGRPQVRRGNTVLATATASLSTSTWYYIELKGTINDTTGSYELRINGSTILSATGVDTRNGGTLGVINNVGFIGLSSARFDDFYVCDTAGSTNNDFLGDCRIDMLLPTADGTYTDGTPSTGTAHYAVVDENPPNTTDYISMDVVDQRDSYGYPDLPVLSSATVYGVQVNAYWLKDDAGSRSAATFARSGTTNSDGASVALSTTAVFGSQIFETDPNTSSAWTQSTINAAEFGTKVTA